MHEELTAVADRLAAAGERPAAPCQDPVNAAMIRNWTQALGDPGNWDDVAPPAMIQVWSMPGLAEAKAGSVADEPLRMLNDNGYTGVVATNCEQTYDRYVKVGETLRSTMRFGGVTGPKTTAMGEGYFVTWYQTWYGADGGRVAEMLFRVLKFKPRQRSGKGGGGAAKKAGRYPLRPAIGQDTAFFWEGVDAGELRVQRCAACGTLRHPPGPMCPRCHSTDRDHVVASGRGTVHSYVVHHHPPVPGRTPPYVVAVVELEEGVRIVGNVNGCAPEDVKVGMPVRLTFERMDDELTLPQWTPADAPPPEPEPEPEARTVPEGALEIELTPTFVIATALATRDFTPVHHDTALARAQGSKDIFVNILTTMGIVQRYALEAVAGDAPDAELESIAVRLGAPAYAGTRWSSPASGWTSGR
ncbi:OB-fold domain-containing protein [Actinomadura yumaensis]|uniref:OB-fold domain-containing protein n=1 Tax=Actinomadura yumaensis TaxID=111807 RepID=UPI00360D4657